MTLSFVPGDCVLCMGFYFHSGCLSMVLLFLLQLYSVYTAHYAERSPLSTTEYSVYLLCTLTLYTCIAGIVVIQGFESVTRA